MEEELELAQQLVAHDGAVRCCCVIRDGRLATGGLDRAVILWRLGDDGKFVKDATFNHHEHFVYALCPSSDGGFYSGSKDMNIFKLDSSGNPVKQFQGHGMAVCSLVETSDLISGSWDGTCKVWDIESCSVRYTLDAGAHAICCGMLNSGELVTGSQSMELKFWKGEELVRTVTGHGDIIRKISPMQHGMLTCSNDSTIKRWTLDGLEMQSLTGHQGFIFDVVACGDDRAISAGDDRTLKVWRLSDGSCAASKLHVGSVWGCCVLPNGDLVSACEDGVARVWTSAPTRFASEDERLTQSQLAQEQAVKDADKGASAVNTENVPSIDQMPEMPGKKEGDVKMFKDGEKVNAYSWSGGVWNYIGEVTGQAEKTNFAGDDYFPAGEYDFVFDVELGEERRAKLPFNKGQNPMNAAVAFLEREKLNRAHLNDVMKFIEQNSGLKPAAPTIGGGGGAPAPSAPKAPPAPAPGGYAQQGNFKTFPVREPVLFKDVKF
jgi:phospholipase A-2-activating protein